MRAGTVSIAMILFLPVNVFAHAGHVEWSLFDLNARSELVEAMLVASAIAVYMLGKRKRNLASSRIKIKRQ